MRRLDVRRVFDLLAFVVAALVTGDDLKAIGNADLGGIGEHRQPAPHRCGME